MNSVNYGEGIHCVTLCSPSRLDQNSMSMHHPEFVSCPGSKFHKRIRATMGNLQSRSSHGQSTEQRDCRGDPGSPHDLTDCAMELWNPLSGRMRGGSTRPKPDWRKEFASELYTLVSPFIIISYLHN